MSRTLSYTIEYEAAYAAKLVLDLGKIVNEATLENWDRYRNQWTEGEPRLLPVERWAEAVAPDRLEELSFDQKRYPKIDYRSFSYSPVSWFNADFVPYDDLKVGREGRLGVLLFLSSGARLEHEGIIQLERMQDELDENPDLFDDDAWFDRLDYLKKLDTPERSVWPQNRACLAHVAERLCAALPVEAVEIDPELRNPDPAS